MTLKKPSGEINWPVVGPGLLTAVLALTTGGGAVGGQVAANAQMAELRVKVATLETGAMDREARIRAIEANLARIAAGVDMLIDEYKDERERVMKR